MLFKMLIAKYVLINLRQILTFASYRKFPGVHINEQNTKIPATQLADSEQDSF